MISKIKLFSLILCSTVVLQACKSDDGTLPTAKAPKQLVNVNTAVYSGIRTASPDANRLFASLGAVNIGDEPCEVKVHRMTYDTIGGNEEKTTSSGMFMLPHGDSPACSGPRPVMLYARSTNPDIAFDLSQFVADPSNPATSEAVLVLAAFASKGYAVVAPNYAGYADSTLGYHPYADEKQQSTEMIDALEHVRTYAETLGADLSSQLFVTGFSQGGYVGMATHKALEAKGETVTASLLISGPYAVLDFIDSIMAGYVILGSTTYFPMVLTAAKKSNAIYDDPSEVYDAAYANFAENSLPRPGGFAESGLPQFALFSGEPPEDANAFNKLGFAEDHLLSDSFRQAYLTDAATNGATPQNSFRAAVAEADMRDWQPGSPMMMCGASTDPVVYFNNTTKMQSYWNDNPFVSSFDVATLPSWQNANISPADTHGQTGAFCAGVGLQFLAKFR